MSFSKTLDPLIVPEFIASLNVTVMAVDTGIPVAPLFGDVETTVGGISSRVVKDSEKIAASPFPATSFAPVVTFAMRVVELGNALVGVNTAVRVAAVYPTAPGIKAPPDVFRKNVVVLIVAASIGSLNVTLTVALDATPVAPAAGVEEVIVGGVTSGIVIADVAVSAESSPGIPICPLAETRYLYVTPCNRLLS